jgi:membrane protease YdiL (CAAX protease family)
MTEQPDWAYPQPAAGQPPYPAYPPQRTTPVDPMPTGPREYQQMNRGPRYAWWKPLLTFLLALGMYLVASVVVVIAWMLVVAGFGANPVRLLQQFRSGHAMGPLLFGYVEATLIILVPIAMLSSWIVHRIRPRFLISVAGGFRWRWFVRCLAITIPIWLIYLGLQLWLDWDYQPKPAHWAALLVLVVVGIPFQSAGEELLFRGLILQNVGSWIPNRIVALVVAAVPSIGLFALAHGSLHGWILADLALFALSSIVLLWRTGGLEASIALHLTNNVVLMIFTILFGGWAGAFVGSKTTGNVFMVALDLVVFGVPIALILWQARRVQLQRIYRPNTMHRTNAPTGTGP